jgi:hypothetical protein
MTRRTSHLKQLTIRGFDPEVAEHLRELARREGLSLNQAVMKLLRRATGTDVGAGPTRGVGSALDDLAGTWSEDDAREFAAAVAPLERIDEDLWHDSAPRSRRRS